MSVVGLYEVFTTKKWWIDPAFVRNFRSGFQERLSRHEDSEDSEKKSGYFVGVKNGLIDFRSKVYVTQDPEWEIEYRERITEEDQFINVIEVDGPITRYGYGCSYGSVHHRDQLLYASKQPNCIGHLILIDTPGGSSISRHDYMDGISACKKAGQKVIGLVDGMCLSAGQALASMCDEVYYVNENNEFGCVGTMASFYTTANGSKNQFTDETYREFYDPESFDKNASWRSLANDDDATALLEELAEDGKEFRELMKQNRPNVTEEHIHGKVFKASEVEGILCEGKSDFKTCVQSLVSLWQSRGVSNKSNSSTQNNKSNMKVYENINSALDVESLPVTEDGGFYCNGPIAEEIDSRLGRLVQAESLLKASNESVDHLNNKVKELQEELDKQASVISSGEESNASLTEKIQNLESELQTSEERVKELENLVATLENTVKEKETVISEKESEIAELSSTGTEAPVPGEEDATGKEESSKPRCVYSDDMTPGEMAEAHRKRMMRVSRP